MKSLPLALVLSLGGVGTALAAPTAARAPVGVSPGAAATFDLAVSCPTFSWTPAAQADGYEIVVYAAGGDGREPALQARLPAGATSWTPAANRCLASGRRYGWSVRTIVDGAGGPWSEALLFEVAEAPTDLAAALEIVRRYLGAEVALDAEAESASAQGGAAVEPSGGGRQAAPQRVLVGGGPATAVRGELPDGVGETYGVRGVVNSPDGAGMRADNNAAGPDVVLGGSPVAEITESSFSRDLASDLTFDFTNPGTGTMTLQVDGSPVFHAANDGAGSTLDADLLDGLDSTAFLGSGTDDWVDEAGDTMTGTLTLSAGDVALHTTATVRKGGSRFLWDDAGQWIFGAGRGALASNTTGLANTAVGTGALDSNTTGSGNTAVGRDALGANTTASANTAVGADALDVNTGTGNVAVGTSALISNTTGGFNTAVGAFAMQENQTGFFNVAIGSSTLLSNNSGYGNTAVGKGALDASLNGNNNVAVGLFALESNTIASGNTAVGSRALDANTTGTNNVALGIDALGASTTASSNAAVGAFALEDNTTGTRNVALGRSALRDNTTASGNTAIGAYALSVSTSGTGNTALGYRAGINVFATGNNIFIANDGVFGDADTIRIGDTQTQAFIAGIGSSTVANGVPVLVGDGGQLGTSTSSRRFKEDIAPVGAEGEALLALRPVAFRYTKEAAGEGERPIEYGLIAEEVAEVFPELVTYDEQGRPEAVRYHLLVPLLLAEVQRLERHDRAQQEEIRALRRRLHGGIP